MRAILDFPEGKAILSFAELNLRAHNGLNAGKVGILVLAYWLADAALAFCGGIHYRYQLSPYVLIWNRDFYYVVGWSEKHDKIAQFRVDRMTAIEFLDLPGRQTPDFDPAEYVQKVFGMYPDDLQTVTLLCENHLMRSVIDRFGESVQTETADDGHFLATVEVAPSPPFFTWVFTFGGGIRITAPAEVLEEMRQMASWLK